jgi:hypothetical protein
VIYDFSNDIGENTYKSIQDFVKDTLFVNFNNFERLVTGVYGSYIERKILGYLHSIDDVKQFVDETEQDDGHYDMEL